MRPSTVASVRIAMRYGKQAKNTFEVADSPTHGTLRVAGRLISTEIRLAYVRHPTDKVISILINGSQIHQMIPFIHWFILSLA